MTTKPDTLRPTRNDLPPAVRVPMVELLTRMK